MQRRIFAMKMLHVTIRTAKFEEEIGFYQNIAGLSIERDMRPMGRNMVFLSNAPGETCIEIIEAPEAADCGNEFLSVGFATKDVDAKRAELIAAGLEATPMISPGPNVKFFFVKDPAGVNVQFM
jgi:lactoylglutathione lyase